MKLVSLIMEELMKKAKNKLERWIQSHLLYFEVRFIKNELNANHSDVQ